MKSTLVVAIIAIAPSAADAACFGSQGFQTCYDGSGNSYTVQRYGNTTQLNGYAADGTVWSQNSQTFGGTTFHNGYTSNGGNWSMTQQQLGGGFQSFNGFDSSGRSFNRTCDSFGNCY
jgi:hypothetical protein